MKDCKKPEKTASVNPEAPHRQPTVQPEKYSDGKKFDEKKFGDRELDGQKIVW